MDDPVSSTAKEIPVETVKLNSFQRVLGVITAPSVTMKNLAERPRILFPILANALGMLGLYLVRFPVYQEFLRAQTELGIARQNIQMTPEQIEAGMKMGTTIGLISAPITSLITWIIISAIVLGAVKIFKGKGSFKQIASIVGYTYVITLIYLILCAAVSFFTGNLLLDSSIANLTNLFMPDIKGTFVYGIIRGIDLFSIWHYVVLAIGIVEVSKLSKAKAYGISGVLFLAGLLLGANSSMYL